MVESVEFKRFGWGQYIWIKCASVCLCVGERDKEIERKRGYI